MNTLDYQATCEGNGKLKRGLVWCTTCGRRKRVDSPSCLQRGWPTCCGGLTMTLDSPEERNAHPSQEKEAT